MNLTASTEILRNIVETAFNRAIDPAVSLGAQLPTDWGEQLSEAFTREIGVSTTPAEISSFALAELSALVESRMNKNSKAQTLLDTYCKLKQLSDDAIYHEINYRWFSTWENDIFNESDSLERAEIIMRMEEEFEVSIPEQDVQSLRTVGQTVRYLWGQIRATELRS